MSISKLTSNASLKQVMDKFEEISLQDFSSIDIVVKSELPNEVKNGQIVIISNIITSNIIIDFDYPIAPQNGDIFIKNLKGYPTIVEIKSSNKKGVFNILKAEQYLNNEWVRLESYKGLDGAWVRMYNEKVLFENGEYHGMVKLTSLGSSGSGQLVNPDTDGTITYKQKNVGYVNSSSSTSIDVSEYSYIRFEYSYYHKAETSLSATFTLGMTDGGGNNTNFTVSESISPRVVSEQIIDKTECLIDIANIETPLRVKIRNETKNVNGLVTDQYLKIHSIKLIG